MEKIVIDAKNILFENVKKSNRNANMAKIEDAFLMAYEAHKGQNRASGEPYILHPIAVADILTELKLDTISIITALLHDTVEDTSISIDDVKRKFGNDVAKLVDGVTKLEKIEYQPENVKQAENFRKLLLAISVDIRVLLVKLADRLHNMRTLSYISNPKKRHRLAHETMEIYAPLAERIGIHAIKNELQDLSFAELYPEIRNSIISRLEFLREDGNKLIKTIEKEIKEELANNDIKAEVSGREKTSCSIWYKMEQKKATFEQIADIVAFRVIVEDIATCYKALGIIHSKYHAISEEFKDYISTPKGNGYQSIHTVIMGPEKRCIEVQIRTKKMHEVAEYGVAAHWKYKQGIQNVTDGTQFRWVRELLDILETTQSPEEFLENTKLEMYYYQVFCFTPKGHLIALPKGATPVDFAFAVHSDVGLTCIGAKVNGRIVPLKTELSNGDQVEILRSKVPMPSPAWEKFVATGKARAEIRKFIRSKQVGEYISLGRALLIKNFKQNNKKYEESILEKISPILKYESVHGLLAAVGEGSVAVNVIMDAYKKIEEEKSTKKFSLMRFYPKKLLSFKNKHTVPIKGLIPGVALHFAGCCNPLPGEKIMGVVNTGSGVTIHNADCEVLKEIASSNPNRVIEVSWDDTDKDLYMGRIQLSITNEIGSLAEIANSIASTGANVTNLKVVGRSSDFFELIVDVEVKNIDQLTSIIAVLRMLKSVHNVRRMRG